jgi:hypothetical protein
MVDLKTEFIKCRDALACAVEFLECVAADGVPVDKLEWLNERLDTATTLADKLAAEESATPEAINRDFLSTGFLHDEDFLRAALDTDDAASLCERISRRHNTELTLEQAEQLLERVENLCWDCLNPLNEETGYCDPCSVPGSA